MVAQHLVFLPVIKFLKLESEAAGHAFGLHRSEDKKASTGGAATAPPVDDKSCSAKAQGDVQPARRLPVGNNQLPALRVIPEGRLLLHTIHLHADG